MNLGFGKHNLLLLDFVAILQWHVDTLAAFHGFNANLSVMLALRKMHGSHMMGTNQCACCILGCRDRQDHEAQQSQLLKSVHFGSVGSNVNRAWIAREYVEEMQTSVAEIPF